jgi:hypothetical protein
MGVDDGTMIHRGLHFVTGGSVSILQAAQSRISRGNTNPRFGKMRGELILSRGFPVHTILYKVGTSLTRLDSPRILLLICSPRAFRISGWEVRHEPPRIEPGNRQFRTRVRRARGQALIGTNNAQTNISAGRAGCHRSVPAVALPSSVP